MTTTPRRPTKQHTKTRRTGAGLVLLSALLLGGGLLMMTSGADPVRALPSEGLVSIAEPSANADQSVFLSALPQRAVAAADNPELANQPWDDAWTVDGLPAWRWRSIDLDVDTSGGTFGIAGSFKQIPVSIAEMVFYLANWLWSVLLAVLKFGFEADELIVLAAGSINAGAAFIGGKLLYMGILFAAILGWRLVSAFLKPKGGGMLAVGRTAVGFVLAFGALAMVTSQASVAHQTYPGDARAQMQVSGTLPWAASKILDVADNVTAPLAGPVIGRVERDGKTADEVINGKDVTEGNDANTGTNPGTTTCDRYTNAMYSEYSSGPTNERVLIVLSRLWENTFYDSWRTATLGESVSYSLPDGKTYNSNIPERAMCHFAESVNNIDASTQHRIARTAYGSALPAVGGTVPSVFGPFDATNNGDRRKATTAWAACRWDGSSWKGQTEFNGSWSDSGSANPYDSLCSKVMQDDEKFDDKFYVFAGKVKDASGKGDAAHRAQLVAAREYGTAYSGANSGGRMVYAFISMLVAGMFLVSFGFIALGLIASMLMAIACITFALPMGFALAAIGRSRQAIPLFKVTLTSLLSESFFTIILSLIVILGGLFQNLISGVGALPGPLMALGNGAAPVAAFFLIKKLLKSMGMADILSPSGAMTFATSAAMASSGNKDWAAKARTGKDGGKTGVQKALSKTPWLGKKAEKLDRYAPTRANWTAEGRDKRQTANAKDENDRQEKLKAQIARRNPDSRLGRMRNKIDNSRLPGGVADRLRGLSGASAIAVLTGALGGPLGLGALGGAKAYQRYRSWSATRRRVGDEPDVDTADDVDYDAGTIHGGRDAEPRRLDSVNSTRTYVETTMDRVYEDMKHADPSSSYTERNRAGVETAMSDMMGSYAESLTGSRALLTDSEMDGLRINAARALGYASGGAMVATAGGVVLPIPFSTERAKAELSDEQLKSFVHWLPSHDRDIQQIRDVAPDGTSSLRAENADEYASRLFALGLARGVLHPDGSSVDVLSLKGLDVADVSVQARITAWRGGNADDLLDNLQINSVDDMLERRLVLAAQSVARAQSIGVVVAAPTATGTVLGAPSVSAPPAPPALADASDAAALTTQLVLAVSAAREMLTEARRGGDDSAVGAAVTKMSASMEKLESTQERLFEALGASMADTLERNLQVQATRDQRFTETFEKSFSDGVGRIETQLDGVRDVLDQFKAGTLSMSAAVSGLQRSLADVRSDSDQSEARLLEVLAEQSRNLGNSGTRGRAAPTWGPPSSRDVAERTGGAVFPSSEER
jgi:hypothetical protein